MSERRSDAPASRRSGPGSSRGDGGDRPREPLKSYQHILADEIALADAEMERSASAIFASGLLAGLGVCVSVFLIAVFDALAGPDTAPVVRRFFVGNAYAAGFLLVIFARADLFTEYTTISLLPVMLGRSTVRSLARLWGIVYAANVVGALAGATFFVQLVSQYGAVTPDGFGVLAAEVTDAPPAGTLLAAILAGWLMGLLSWLIVAGRETVSQLVFVWVIGVTIGMGHLPHSITGTAEVAAGVIAAAGATAGDLLEFSAIATLGNALGSVLFAVLVRYAVASRHPDGID